MYFRVFRCSAAVLILLTLFTPAVLLAAPASETKPAAVRVGGSFLEQVRSVLSALWEAPTLSGDNGSGFDPDGDLVTGDNGSGVDPSGRS